MSSRVFCLALLLSMGACSGQQKKTVEGSGKNGTSGARVEARVSPVNGISAAAHILPPAVIAVGWVDIDALRESDLWPEIEARVGAALVDPAAKMIFEKVSVLAVGIYPAKHGLEPLLIAEGQFNDDESFAMVKEWAKGIGEVARPLELGGRRALKIRTDVFVRLDENLYAGGSETLTTYCVGLMDKQRTGHAASDSLEYLQKKSTIDSPVFIVYAKIPHYLDGWLTEKRIPSLQSGRLMLSVAGGREFSFNLGVLPGKEIRPIWLANEINTFLVRSAKNKTVKKLGLDKWVEQLDTKLLGKGVVVKGKIEKDQLVLIADEIF
ncbi:MAG: hypothetical protein ABIJ56_21000 [Pseudomonadota bacterium]